MQNTMHTTANNEEHNNWYKNMFAANIKAEPGVPQHSQAPASSGPSSSHLENYLKQQNQQHFTPMDTNMIGLPPAPTYDQNLVGKCKQKYFDTPSMHQKLLQQQQYQQHFQQAQQAAAKNQVTSHLPLGFNPLTPPGLPQAILPRVSQFYQQATQKQACSQQQATSPHRLLENTEKAALTPSSTPPMDITPPKSPKAPNPSKPKEHQPDQESSSCSDDIKCIAESEDEDQIRSPLYNSHGKMKNYKCKSCGLVAITKLTFWEHAKTHMKPEKILQCSSCPFVTELKHHLEYHIRKHKNLKPFQCDKCSYSCVNKSMLNSHRKSHSSVYQYRCADCDYATKYCHSFKLHLRKYSHKPGLVLDEDGVPNPSIVIDVYGTRRGPKNKGSSGSAMKKSNTDLKTPSQLSAALQGLIKNQKPDSPAKNTASIACDLPALTINMSLQQQQQQQQHQQQHQQQQQTSNGQISPPTQQPSQAVAQNGNLSNIFPSLASFLQQNPNLALLPYWNLNMQMLAAQQQAAILTQLSPTIRERWQKFQNNENQLTKEMEKSDDDDEDYNDNDNDNDTDNNSEPVEQDDQQSNPKSLDSAMDLSQGTPTREDPQKPIPEPALNLKLPEENIETPTFIAKSRRKGRVLKLDQEQLKNEANSSEPPSPQDDIKLEIPNAPAAQPPANKINDSPATDESMETSPDQTNNNTSTASSSASGNSSNSNSTNTSKENSANSHDMHECKYCDIYFKDDVLYTIHMGYHSCDDVFRCNMCGEKCDGPTGLFVHMARYAH